MADLSDEDIKKIAAATSGGNSAPKASLDTSGLGEKLKNLAGEVSPLIVGFNRLTTGATAAETALQGLGKLTGLVPGLSGFGNAIGEAGSALLKNKTQMDDAGKMGLGGNNLGLYNQQVAQLGVTTTEYNQLMKNYGNNINGLAGSAQRSSEVFTKLGSDVRDSGTGRQLQQLGVGAEELAQITALSAINGRKIDLSKAEDYQKQKVAAQELAQQIAETSLITGMNREAITKSVEAETKKPGVMLAMMQMDQDQKNNFLKTQSQLASLGPSVQSLASEIVTGGVRTKEGIATMTALGPAGEELQRAVKQQQSLSATASEEEKKRAKEAVELATAKVNERIASKEYAQIANTATGDTARQMLRIAEENKGVQTQMAAVAEAGGDLSKATKAQRDEAQARIAGQKVDETGKPVTVKNEKGEDVRVIDEGTRLSRTLNDANARAAIQAEGLARNFKLANDELGKSPDAIKTFNTLLRGAGTATSGEQAQKQQKELFDQVNTRKGAETATPPNYDPSKAMPVVGKPPAKLAEGGIVEPQAGGTPAIIGEGGKSEAVIPLDKLDGMMKSKDSGGINIAEISKTISTTLSSAQSPNEGKKIEADKGPLEAVLSDYQKTVLKYAATEGEMKQVQIDNEKNIIRGSEAVILENKKRIAEIEKDADGRELTRREQNRIEKIQSEIQGQQESIAMRKEALAVYENIDALSNQNIVEAKKTASEETMASLKEQEAAGYAANRAAALARDALEDKAEAEGRSMTEAEEAQYKLLGVELNASSNKITAAQEAQKALERSEQEKAFQMKVQQQRDELATESAVQATEIAKINAVEQANIQEAGNSRSLENATETIRINGKIVDPNSSEAQAVKAQISKTFENIIPDPGKLQAQMKEASYGARIVKPTNTPKPEEIKSQMEGMFSKIGGGGGILGDMFNPKIIDTKLAEANKAKLAEVKKEEPKPPTPAAKPVEKPAESKPANAEIGIKDLNDQLKMLNMNMLKLISHSETISGASEKTAKNSAKATGNRYA
jgi:hypothetical protein